MKHRLVKSLMVSLEWRAIAFVITNLFLWFVTGHFWQSTALALGLQAILFGAHFIWYFTRQGEPVFPQLLPQRIRTWYNKAF